MLKVYVELPLQLQIPFAVLSLVTLDETILDMTSLNSPSFRQKRYAFGKGISVSLFRTCLFQKRNIGSVYFVNFIIFQRIVQKSQFSANFHRWNALLHN